MTIERPSYDQQRIAKRYNVTLSDKTVAILKQLSKDNLRGKVNMSWAIRLVTQRAWDTKGGRLNDLDDNSSDLDVL